MFPCEWQDSYETLCHIGPVGFEDFYRNLKTAIAKDEREFENVKNMAAPQWVVGYEYTML